MNTTANHPWEKDATAKAFELACDGIHAAERELRTLPLTTSERAARLLGILMAHKAIGVKFGVVVYR